VVSREGYQPLPPQERPVVMNVKGASASISTLLSCFSSKKTADDVAEDISRKPITKPGVYADIPLDYYHSQDGLPIFGPPTTTLAWSLHACQDGRQPE
jgi:hypothetical protein